MISWSLFQVQSDLLLSIVNYGISKHYAGSQVGYLLIGSSLFLQVTRPAIKSWMGSKWGKFWRRTYELAALERFEKSP